MGDHLKKYIGCVNKRIFHREGKYLTFEIFKTNEKQIKTLITTVIVDNCAACGGKI